MKPGRNDPCPCGSGKKYKHCCLNPVSEAFDAPTDIAWQRLRRLFVTYPDEMLRFVKIAYGPEAFAEAWEEFTLWEKDEEEFDPASPRLQAFMPWVYHQWSPDPEDTSVADATLHGVVPTAAYLQRRGERLDPLLREYLESCLAEPFSFYEVVRCDPGQRFRLREVVTGEEREVLERSASRGAEVGELLYGQLAAAGGIVLLEACAPGVIPPIEKLPVIAFRERIASKRPLPDRTQLRDWDAELRELYLEIEERVTNPKMPALHNTDGEPLSMQRVVFDIDSPQLAFQALKHLAPDRTQEELLAEAERNAQGALTRVRFDWVKAGNAVSRGWDNTVMGTIEIAGPRLTVDVNSAERAAAVRAAIESALGAGARYRATQIQSTERLIEEARRAREETGSSEAAGESLAELPEVKAKIAEMMEQHYERWVDQGIPALEGRTPRQAMRDPAGCERVEALVREMERSGRSMRPPLDPAILHRLRERLGLPLATP